MNITGTPTFVLPDTGTLTSSLATLNLVSGGGIEGGGASGATVTGNVVAQSGSQITVGLAAVASSLSFSNDLSLNGGSTVNLDLSDNPGAGLNDVINVGGNLTRRRHRQCQHRRPRRRCDRRKHLHPDQLQRHPDRQPDQLRRRRRRHAQDLYRRPTTTTPNAIQVSVGGSNPLALTWIGNVNNDWDLIGDANWNSGGPQQFFNQDNVTFNDTSTNLNAVQLVGSLKPGSVTVDATRNYTFAGTGSIDRRCHAYQAGHRHAHRYQRQQLHRWHADQRWRGRDRQRRQPWHGHRDQRGHPAHQSHRRLHLR